MQTYKKQFVSGIIRDAMNHVGADFRQRFNADLREHAASSPQGQRTIGGIGAVIRQWREYARAGDLPCCIALRAWKKGGRSK